MRATRGRALRYLDSMKSVALCLTVLLIGCEPGTLSTPEGAPIIIIPPSMDAGPADGGPAPEPEAPAPEAPQPEPEAPQPEPEAPQPDPPAPEAEPEPEADPCAGFDCGPAGRCEAGRCLCDPGFEAMGDTCVAVDPCRGVQCGANAACSGGDCVCQPGFVDQGGACVPAPMTPLEQRTEEAVCAHWAAEHRRTDGPEWTGGNAACDAGEVPGPAQENAIRRTNLYRWQAGLAPIALDVPRVPVQQACATVLAALRRLSHSLTPDMPCYSAEAAQGASSSNLSGGGGLADSVDLYITDPGAGNAELGHRRWILNPAMAETAFGYKGGYGCMYSFSNSARHAIDFVAWPTPGFLPERAARGRFHVAFYGVVPDGANFRIEAALNDAPLAEVESWSLNTGYGRSRAAYGYEPPGGINAVWQAGNTLTVALRGLRDHDDIVFTTRFTACR